MQHYENAEKPNFDKADMIKGGYVAENATQLRERFITEYSKMKGWNSSNLTTEQLLEITTQKGYKTPGMING